MLTANGKHQPSGMEIGGWFGGMGYMIGAALTAMFVGRQLGLFVGTPNVPDLLVLKEMAETGKIAPVIDRTYPLEEGAAAMAHLDAGHVRGKIAITT